MLSDGKTVEVEVARINTSLVDSGAYVKNVVIESTSMRKSFY